MCDRLLPSSPSPNAHTKIASPIPHSWERTTRYDNASSSHAVSQTGNGATSTAAAMASSAPSTSSTTMPYSCDTVRHDRSARTRTRKRRLTIPQETWFIFLVKHVALGTPRGRSLYWWSEMMYFTNHDFSTNERIVVCFDAPEVMRRSVTQQLMSASPGQSSTDIYDTHVLLLDAIQTIYEKSVWTIRTAVRNIERVCGSLLSFRRFLRMIVLHPPGLTRRYVAQSGLDIDTTETDFPYLHETARHAIHSAETLGVAVETISNLCLHHEELQDSLTKTSFARKPEDRYDGSEGLECRRRDRDVHCVRQQLRFHLQMMKSLHARSVANSARLQNQLTLVRLLISLSPSSSSYPAFSSPLARRS